MATEPESQRAAHGFSEGEPPETPLPVRLNQAPLAAEAVEVKWSSFPSLHLNSFNLLCVFYFGKASDGALLPGFF